MYALNKEHEHTSITERWEAIDDYSQAITLGDEDEDNYFCRSYSYGKVKLYSNAIDDLNIAIKINPKQGLYYRNRGVYKMKSGWDRYYIEEDYKKACKYGQNVTCGWY